LFMACSGRIWRGRDSDHGTESAEICGFKDAYAAIRERQREYAKEQELLAKDRSRGRER
jgi:hypothetical protein